MRYAASGISSMWARLNVCLEGHAAPAGTRSYAADPASSWSNPRDVEREQTASASTALAMRHVLCVFGVFSVML